MNKVHKLVLSAVFLATGMLLPFLTGQIRSIGHTLLPMHIPVLLCSFICGWKYGLAVGAILPIFRSLCFSMPVLYPNAFAMAFELASYGFLAGYIYNKLKIHNLKTVYLSLILSMILGRIIWGLVQGIILGFGANGFTLKMFVARAFLNGIPGIVVQLILIPVIVFALKKSSNARITIDKN